MFGKNKYVNFVSDKDFLKCVEHVCKGYAEARENLSIDDLRSNGLDPFKTIFDLINKRLNFDTWLKNEEMRQADKTLNNRIGEFHQKLLGNVKGWMDLGTGDDSKVDLMKEDKSIFIELKNKFNTVNSDSLDKVRDKLEKAIQQNRTAKAYWAFIISKNNSSGDKVWIKKGRKASDRIRVIYGSKVYELVTRDKDALKKTWLALPRAINDYFRGKSVMILEEDMKKLVGLFGLALQ